MISEPVRLSPTKPMALMSGCSVSALPASSPMPLTTFHTPGGRPAPSAISTRRRAVSGENSAGLWTTVQPAASAGAIFQVESMKGVFQGVMMPTGPIGARDVMLSWPSVRSTRPSRASGARSAKKRKFSAPRSAALAMNFRAWPVSMHSKSHVRNGSKSEAMEFSAIVRLVPNSRNVEPVSALANEVPLKKWIWKIREWRLGGEMGRSAFDVRDFAVAETDAHTRRAGISVFSENPETPPRDGTRWLGIEDSN